MTLRPCEHHGVESPPLCIALSSLLLSFPNAALAGSAEQAGTAQAGVCAPAAGEAAPPSPQPAPSMAEGGRVRGPRPRPRGGRAGASRRRRAYGEEERPRPARGGVVDPAFAKLLSTRLRPHVRPVEVEPPLLHASPCRHTQPRTAAPARSRPGSLPHRLSPAVDCKLWRCGSGGCRGGSGV